MLYALLAVDRDGAAKRAKDAIVGVTRRRPLALARGAAAAEDDVARARRRWTRARRRIDDVRFVEFTLDDDGVAGDAFGRDVASDGGLGVLACAMPEGAHEAVVRALEAVGALDVARFAAAVHDENENENDDDSRAMKSARDGLTTPMRALKVRDVDADARAVWPVRFDAEPKTSEASTASGETIEQWRAHVRALEPKPRVFTSFVSSSTPWTMARVRECIDEDMEADAHVCPSDVVDLAGHRAPNTKRNFEFRKMPLGELLTRVSQDAAAQALEPVIERGERYYLRSVEGKVATDLRRTHPALAAALDVPEIWPAERFHSSVLRISSPGTTLWMHYDTHDNVLVQVVGRKRVALFPPAADPYMYAQGSSSRVEDIAYPPRAPDDYAKFPLFYDKARESRVDFQLNAGDALFIPAFWYHHVYAEDSEPSVAVNVFWRSLTDDEYDAKDIYGNKDLRAGKDAVDSARRAGEGLRHLPEPYKTFYLRRATRALAEQAGLKIVDDDAM
jgi:tRNA wybutosine-synthesizing protein 5